MGQTLNDLKPQKYRGDEQTDLEKYMVVGAIRQFLKGGLKTCSNCSVNKQQYDFNYVVLQVVTI